MLSAIEREDAAVDDPERVAQAVADGDGRADLVGLGGIEDEPDRAVVALGGRDHLPRVWHRRAEG